MVEGKRNHEILAALTAVSCRLPVGDTQITPPPFALWKSTEKKGTRWKQKNPLTIAGCGLNVHPRTRME